MNIVKYLSFVIALLGSSLAQTANAQGLLESLVKGVVENAAKAALEKAAGGAAAPAANAAATNALAAPQMQPMAPQMQPMTPAQASAPAIADPGCKRGQLINPYFIMLQANLLPDASLADMACVSSTQLAGLNVKYGKVGLK